MKTLIFLITLLNFTFSIALYEDNNSNTIRYNLEISDPEVISCLNYNETIDSTEAAEETCNSHIFQDDNYRCCYITYTVGNDYSNQFCKIIAFNVKSINDVKKSFSHAGHLKILCNEFFIKINYFILFLFLLIILN